MLLSQVHPGGCYIGFNASIDRKAAEQLAFLCGDAAKNKFASVNLLISSIGGILDHAYYLCTILDALPIEIITFNIGNVMSAANLLFLCGKKRYAIEGATFYFHQAHYPSPADQISASFARSRVKAIARDDARGAGFISSKIGVPVKDIIKWQNGELFMDTKTALASGVIHGIKAPVITPDALFVQTIV